MAQAINDLITLPKPKTHLELTRQFAPIASSDRIQLLDVLRGFALFGVLVANIFWSFNGFSFVSPQRALQLTASPIDAGVYYFIRFFIDKKFIYLFSLLFGFGFAVQVMRAEEKGSNIAVFYSRRQLILFFIGMAHLLLFWHGDILHVYALCGLFVLAFARSKGRTLLVSAVALTAGAVLLMIIAIGIQALASAMMGTGALDTTLDETRRQFSNQVLAAFAHGSYGDMLQWNAKVYFGSIVGLLYIFPLTAGRFLLGFYAGRRRLFNNVAANLPLFRKLLWWSLPIGLVSSALFVVGTEMMRAEVIDGSVWRLLLIIPTEVSSFALCLFYVATLTLLYQRATWQKRLSVLAPLGRMALTNYLTQTLLCLLIFYGGGQIGQTGPARCLLIALVIYSAQVILSTLWLTRFQMGPVEWLWRTLSYGKLQPLVRQPRVVRT